MPKDRRERLLSLARAAREFPGALRRHAIAGLIHERYRQEAEAAVRGDVPNITVTVEEIILCAYTAVNSYWAAWLHDPLPPGELIARLAEASATSETDLLRRTWLLQEVVAKCPLDLSRMTARDVARWLTEHPDSDGLLPPSLLAYYERTAAPSDPDPKSNDEAMPADETAPAATPQPNPSPSSSETTTTTTQPEPEKKTTPTPVEALDDYLKTHATPSWNGFFKRYRRSKGLSGLPGFSAKELSPLWDAKNLPYNPGGRGRKG
jgi:hypothetical protein